MGNETSAAMITVGALVSLTAIAVAINAAVNFGLDGVMHDEAHEVRNFGNFIESNCNELEEEGDFVITREHEIELNEGSLEIDPQNGEFQLDHDETGERSYDCEVDLELDIQLGEGPDTVPLGDHALYVESTEEDEKGIRVFSN